MERAPGPADGRPPGSPGSSGEFAHCLDAAMAGQDVVPVVDQQRIGETEATNAFGNLADLFSRVGARIARSIAQLPNRQVLTRTAGH
jgi:hypothetical protein